MDFFVLTFLFVCFATWRNHRSIFHMVFASPWIYTQHSHRLQRDRWHRCMTRRFLSFFNAIFFLCAVRLFRASPLEVTSPGQSLRTEHLLRTFFLLLLLVKTVLPQSQTSCNEAETEPSGGVQHPAGVPISASLQDEIKMPNASRSQCRDTDRNGQN